MTKDELLSGFNFANQSEVYKLKLWLDDDTLGTSERKALVIVGPMASGKSTLLDRISQYKGELMTLFECPGSGPLLCRSFARVCGLLESFRDRKVVLLNDLALTYSVVIDIEQILGNDALRILKPNSFNDYVSYPIRASLAIALDATYQRHEKCDSNRRFLVVHLANRHGGVA